MVLHNTSQLLIFTTCNKYITNINQRLYVCVQGLIQKEKVHINCKKGAQINILTNKIVT